MMSEKRSLVHSSTSTCTVCETPVSGYGLWFVLGVTSDFDQSDRLTVGKRFNLVYNAFRRCRFTRENDLRETHVADGGRSVTTSRRIREGNAGAAAVLLS